MNFLVDDNDRILGELSKNHTHSLDNLQKRMIIYIPEGDVYDPTRNPDYYDGIYNYLRTCGLQDLDNKQLTTQNLASIRL